MFRMDCEGRRVSREQTKRHRRQEDQKETMIALSEQVGGRGEYWRDLKME